MLTLDVLGPFMTQTKAALQDRAEVGVGGQDQHRQGCGASSEAQGKVDPAEVQLLFMAVLRNIRNL
jgi:hypothetical protein